MANAAILSGEIALVTGAGRGIGAATVAALIAAGARIAVTARRKQDAEAVSRSFGLKAMALGCDVTESDCIAATIEAVTHSLGAPTILINNAGTVQPIGLLHETDPAAWATSIAANLTGAAAMARAVLPAMLATGAGTIINLSSGAAHRPLEGWSAYCAAKAGLAMLTQSLALEYGGKGIRAFGFSPGVVDTGMQGEIRASGMNPVSQLPREQLAGVSDPAKAIVYLCSTAGNDLVGREVDIRDAAFRARVGLD